MKNTKIMAVLVVLLAAMLFVGAASATAVSEENFKNLTANVSSFTAAASHESPDILIYNTSAWVESNNYEVWINWGDDTTLNLVTLKEAQGTGSYNATVNHIYTKAGTYTVTLYNASTVSDTTQAKTLATITVVNAKDVKKDGYAFVYEYIYVPGATTLTKYSEGTNPTAVKQIAGTKGLFYLTESVVGGQYGAYYYKEAPGSTNPGEYIYIWYPELTIQAELTDPDTTWGATAGDSIDGKTINKDTNVTFLVNTPMVGPVNVNDRFDDLAVKIVFTTPVGGKTTVFGTYDDGTVANYNDVDVTATQNVAGSAIPGIDAVAGTYTAQAEFINYAPFANNAEKSNTISFTVQSTSMSLSADKDSVIRSNPFTVTIQGSANTVYFVYIEGSDDNQPYLLPSQSGYQAEKGVYVDPVSGAPYRVYNGVNQGSPVPLSPVINADPVTVGSSQYYSYGYFQTDASGKRTVQYNTLDNTDDKTYTIRVMTFTQNGIYNVKGDDYDTAKVKVEKGAVTISASGDGSYYLGDEITLSGTNTDSPYVFLFITGPNLDYADGVILKNLPTQTAAYLASNPVDVKTDNTWEYKWDTSNIALDTGAYTIYATSKLTNGKASGAIEVDKSNKYATHIADGTTSGYYAVKLSDSEYATVSVNLKQPFLSAVPSATVVAKGDKIYITGTAEGNPSSLYLYMFGPNYYEKYTVSVESDGSYEKKIEIPSTLASNQYFVVVQHPMYNGQFDAFEEKGVFQIRAATTGGSQQGSFVVTGANKLQGSQAA
ncbi:MAG TPA: PKD domain-containing protein, partial [Methanocorpusculum sp.]|nr:PKD domain-containing protein [Methanocorpusculum sp.]